MKDRRQSGRPISGGANRSGRTRPTPFWVVAIAAAVIVHAAAFALLDVSPMRPGAVVSPPQVVRWVGDRPESADPVVRDQLALKDPTPLFLPTRWNFESRRPSGSDDRPPGDIFPPDPPNLTVPEKGSPPGLVILPSGMATAGEMLRRFPRPYHLAFGQIDVPLVRIPVRAGVVEVRSTAGRTVVQEVVPVEAAPGMESWPDWRPFEILVAVESTGTLGPPLVPAPGSGVESVDDFFRDYLRSRMRLDLRVRPGYYHAVIVP